MDFTKKDTSIGKGIAICLMIIHHLFNSDARILEGNVYVPLLIYKNLEIHIARFGKICVASFLFLSGYGLYLSYRKSDKKILSYVIGKLKRFYPVFWAQFIVFVPIGYLFFSDVTIINQDTLRYVPDLKVFLMSFFGLSSRYNGAWWFVTLYLELLILIFPFYYYLINRKFSAFILITVTVFTANFIYGFPVHLLLYQTSFAFGMFCAKYDVFSSRLVKKIDSLNLGVIILIFFLCFPLRAAIGVNFDFILAPVFLYSSIRIIKSCTMSSVFEYLGRYSFPMWINHNFFALYFFQYIMFLPKYSPLIVLFVIVSSLTASLIIEKLQYAIFQRITKKEIKRFARYFQ